MSQSNPCITYRQYKEFLERVEEAEAAGEKLIISNIAYDWGVKPETLKRIQKRGIKQYDARLRKEKAMEELNKQAWELLSLMHKTPLSTIGGWGIKIQELLDRRRRYE